MAERESLRERGRAEENQFFAKRDRELIEKLKQQKAEEQEQTVKELATARCPRDGERLARVQPNTELFEALQTMDETNVAQAPVMEGDHIVGLLSREQVLHYIRIRSELGM